MSETYRFPGAFVWQTVLSNHSEIKARVLPEILAIAETEGENPSYTWSDNSNTTVKTNYGPGRLNPMSLFTEEEVRAIAYEPLRVMQEETSLSWLHYPRNMYLRAFWWNRYQAGSTAPPHVHSPGISGIYVLEQEEKSPLRFFDCNGYSFDSDSMGTYYTPEVEEGSVLLFPGTMMHWVEPTKGYRTTVSFNLSENAG